MSDNQHFNRLVESGQPVGEVIAVDKLAALNQPVEVLIIAHETDTLLAAVAGLAVAAATACSVTLLA